MMEQCTYLTERLPWWNSVHTWLRDASDGTVYIPDWAVHVMEQCTYLIERPPNGTLYVSDWEALVMERCTYLIERPSSWNGVRTRLRGPRHGTVYVPDWEALVMERCTYLIERPRSWNGVRTWLRGARHGGEPEQWYRVDQRHGSIQTFSQRGRLWNNNRGRL